MVYLLRLMSVRAGSRFEPDKPLDVHLATCSAGTGSVVRQSDGRLDGCLEEKGPAAALLHEITEGKKKHGEEIYAAASLCSRCERAS